jgi:hypothetical protein
MRQIAMRATKKQRTGQGAAATLLADSDPNGKKGKRDARCDAGPSDPNGKNEKRDKRCDAMRALLKHHGLEFDSQKLVTVSSTSLLDGMPRPAR